MHKSTDYTYNIHGLYTNPAYNAIIRGLYTNNPTHNAPNLYNLQIIF